MKATYEKRLCRAEAEDMYRLMTSVESILMALEGKGIKERLKNTCRLGAVKSAHTLLKNSVDDLFTSVPTEQLAHILRQAGHLEFKVMIAKDPNKARLYDEGFWMSIKDLNVLGNAAVQQCILCTYDHQDRESCKLRKVLDNLPVKTADYDAQDCPYMGMELR